MRNKYSRSNALLVEILIAVFFFMISATVLVRVFVTSRNLTMSSGVETLALGEAQNVVDAIYVAEDVDADLSEMGFVLSHGVWTRPAEDRSYTLYVEGGEVPTEAGSMWKGTVRAYYSKRDANDIRQADEELFALSCTRYREGRQ